MCVLFLYRLIKLFSQKDEKFWKQVAKVEKTQNLKKEKQETAEERKLEKRNSLEVYIIC